MTNNLYEFISAVCLVSIFTSAAVTFRYAIYKMGKQDEVLQRVRVEKSKREVTKNESSPDSRHY